MKKVFLALCLLIIFAAGYQSKKGYLTSTSSVSVNPKDLIVYVANDRLWLTDSRGSESKPLTSEKIIATNPAWSTNKKKIAFLYGSQKQLAFLNLVTKKIELAKTEDNADIINVSGAISWFPDNQRVAYSQNELNGSQTVYYYHLKFRRPVIFWIKEFDITNEFNPAVANDGKYLAFVWRYQKDARFVQELWKLDTFSGQDLVKIVALPGLVQTVDWSPKSQKVAFEIKESEANGSAAVVSNIYVQNKDGTDRVLIRRRASNPKFDNQGQRLLYQRYGRLWIINLKSNQSRQIPNIKDVTQADW